MFTLGHQWLGQRTSGGTDGAIGCREAWRADCREQRAGGRQLRNLRSIGKLVNETLVSCTRAVVPPGKGRAWRPSDAVGRALGPWLLPSQ